MTGLLAAVAGMLVAAATDVFFSRAGAVRVTAYGASLIAGFCSTLLAAFLLTGQFKFHVLAIAALAYAAWWFAFLNLVQALASSLRVRLLQEIRASGGRISRRALHERYNDHTLLSLRLQRLLSRGSVVEVDEHLHVASTGLTLIAWFFRTLKKAATGRTSEFGTP